MMAAAPADAPLPVTLVTGFLGSGKTTLVNTVLRYPAFARSMVIVNEFGSVGLDHLLIEGGVDDVLLLDSGCLCCAATGSLRDTLIDLLARRQAGSLPPFDRVIVETSGLANPAPLIATLLADSALRGRCRLVGVLTLVDAVHGAATLARYAEAARQAALADRLVLSKTDLVNDFNIEALRAQLSERNPQAPLALWQRGQDPAPLFADINITEKPRLRGPLRPQYADDALPLHGPAFAALQATVLAALPTTDWAAYALWSAHLRRHFGANLLRCKGLLRINAADGSAAWWVIQAVQGHFMPPEKHAGRAPADGLGFLVCISDGVAPTDLQASAELLQTQLAEEVITP